MNPPTPSPVTLPALQARSREKLERVLLAAEALLEEKLLEEITMADLAERAGVAVGTLYTRFKSKQDLLPALFARHDAAVGARLVGLFKSLGALPGLRERIEKTVGFAVDYHRKHRGLLRALTMYVRANQASLPAQLWRERASQYRDVAQLVMGDCQEIAHPDPLQATEFALGIINSVCREQVLFDGVTPLRGRTSWASLKARLTHMVHSDLTLPRP